ncbi:Hypothetical predicted protein [Paramuricea clavata]|uniref:Uncharacterized protein n=1 Tax=Paramuricea clavata TaxID=317549 RepID=A0A6S7JH25_PARCT|nr:Hypothetical predicted protein [Paramuricea clavata]
MSTPSCPAQVSKVYARNSSLNRAVNNVKKALPKSPRKKKMVIRKLLDEYGEVESTNVKKRHLLSLEAETIEAVKSFYTCDDISRIAPGKRDVVTMRNADGSKKCKSDICI